MLDSLDSMSRLFIFIAIIFETGRRVQSLNFSYLFDNAKVL